MIKSTAANAAGTIHSGGQGFCNNQGRGIAADVAGHAEVGRR